MIIYMNQSSIVACLRTSFYKKLVTLFTGICSHGKDIGRFLYEINSFVTLDSVQIHTHLHNSAYFFHVTSTFTIFWPKICKIFFVFPILMLLPAHSVWHIRSIMRVSVVVHKAWNFPVTLPYSLLFFSHLPNSSLSTLLIRCALYYLQFEIYMGF